MTQPTTGRIVHYLSRGSADGKFAPECRAALVTQVHEGQCVGLAVLNPTGLFFDEHICSDEGRTEGGTWHWPCVRAEETHRSAITGRYVTEQYAEANPDITVEES